MARKVPAAAGMLAISRVMEWGGGYGFVVLLPLAIARGSEAVTATVPPLIFLMIAYACGVFSRALAEDLLGK